MNKEELHIFYDDGLKVEFSSSNNYSSSSAWQDILLELSTRGNFKKECEQDRLVVNYDDIVVTIDDWRQVFKNQILQKYFTSIFSNKQNEHLNSVVKYNQRVREENNKNVPLKKVNLPKPVNGNYVNSEDPYLSSILQKRVHDKHLEEQKKEQKLQKTTVKQTPVTVTRNNKFSSKKIVVGGLTLLALTSGLALYHVNSLINEKQNKEQPDLNVPDNQYTETDQNYKETSNKDYVTFLNNEEKISTNDNFEIGLNINDVLESKEQSDNSVALEKDDNNYTLSYQDRSFDDKVIITQAKYGNSIERNAKKCGIDPKIILGIATQESGDHELGLRSGSKGGLMQIEMSYWRNKDITYYDFDDKEYYVIKITDDAVKEVDNCILIGCAILQNELKSHNYNIPLAIQSYNMGYSNMNRVLDVTSLKTGLTKMQIVNNPDCLEWMNYTNVVNSGDPDYVKKVLSYIGYGYDVFELNCLDENNAVKSCSTLPITTSSEKTI